MKQKRIIIKIGTNVITQNLRLDLFVIAKIVEQVAVLHKRGYQVVLVSSGAVASGREVLPLEREKNKTIKKQMLAAIGQARLMHVYEKLFSPYGIVIAQALLERDDFSHREKYLNLRSTILKLLEARVIPIINENDVIATEEIRFSDNDQLAALTACALNADVLVICTDIDGFYTADPRKDSNAVLLQEISEVSSDIYNMAGNSSSGVGLGGMISKIGSAQIACKQGIDTFICNGKKNNAILLVIEGKNPGTHIIPSPQKIKQLQNWGTTALISKGILTIDDGAKMAVLKRKSLLLVGIKKTNGEFQQNQPVLIQDEHGIQIGIGIVNYSSHDIKQFITKQISSPRKECIHANKLFIYESNHTTT
jgi:glutamate 5-kinase